MRNKKFYKWFIIITSMAFTLSLVSSSVFAKGTQDVDMAFESLQSEITETLVIKDNRYIYDENRIKDIIMKSDIDFNELNSKYDTHLSKEIFYKIAIKNIGTTNLSIVIPEGESNVCTLGSYCNRNAETSGWNYKRYFCSYSATRDWIADEDELSLRCFAMGVGTAALGGPVGEFFGPAFAFSGEYHSLLSSALSSNNGSCGTVTDINSFTAVFTVVSQSNF